MQLLASSTAERDALARFILYDAFTRLVRNVPIWGGSDSLTEHVFNRLPDRLPILRRRNARPPGLTRSRPTAPVTRGRERRAASPLRGSTLVHRGQCRSIATEKDADQVCGREPAVHSHGGRGGETDDR